VGQWFWTSKMLMVPLGIEYIWETVNQSGSPYLQKWACIHWKKWVIAIFEAPRSATTACARFQWLNTMILALSFTHPELCYFDYTTVVSIQYQQEAPWRRRTTIVIKNKNYNAKVKNIVVAKIYHSVLLKTTYCMSLSNAVAPPEIAVLFTKFKCF